MSIIFTLCISSLVCTWDTGAESAVLSTTSQYNGCGNSGYIRPTPKTSDDDIKNDYDHDDIYQRTVISSKLAVRTTSIKSHPTDATCVIIGQPFPDSTAGPRPDAHLQFRGWLLGLARLATGGMVGVLILLTSTNVQTRNLHSLCHAGGWRSSYCS